MSQQEITIEISENNLEQLRAIELSEADNKKNREVSNKPRD